MVERDHYFQYSQNRVVCRTEDLFFRLVGLQDLVVWIRFLSFLEWSNSSMCNNYLQTGFLHITCALCFPDMNRCRINFVATLFQFSMTSIFRNAFMWSKVCQNLVLNLHNLVNAASKCKAKCSPHLPFLYMAWNLSKNPMFKLSL
jgi:hypothetical protein